jgi:hypothetical protein
MGRFILRFRGQGAKPHEHVARIRALADTVVLDDSSPRMLLVEGSEEALQDLLASLPGWVLSAERKLSLPDPRPNPRRLPSVRHKRIGGVARWHW